MKAQLKAIIGYAVLLTAIFMGFKLYKWVNHVVIEENDASMEPEYPPGSHWLGGPPAGLDQIPLDHAVAYYEPGFEGRERVGWAIAKEGQVIEVREKKVWVDGALSPRQPRGTLTGVPRFVVPRGCVFIVTNVQGEASFQCGPLPLRNIRGVLKSGFFEGVGGGGER